MKAKDLIIYAALLLLVGYFFYDQFVKEEPDYSYLIEENKELKGRLEKIEDEYTKHDRAETYYYEKIDTIHEKIDTTNKPGLRDLFDDFKHRTN